MDPFFSPADTSFPIGAVVLNNSETPALSLADLPPIDAILLSHEDHPDNLDDLGPPRPGVLVAGGKEFSVTGTPCEHLPGGECIGFIPSSDSFGSTDGLPSVIYFSGDTVYMEELVQIKEKYHVVVALLNLGAAVVHFPDGLLFWEIGAEVLVLMYFESWNHFTQGKTELKRRVCKETKVA
ncbi:hypothetical protein K505DRAFT_352959 [Melanomma pulvis-pyrius CBS 109.77]|uniref:Metallo-beta-lactamase domain-containing protein n=1 Tax=Melanomma pulvis-pyrius CBS 109.77 TaxID=1314802 RepID=A0A6A6WY05_9PLEO|nr:hypothetical protein K505DRAFT_352959 [Melanomma pulvis-pyrius CBS 109.77]